MPNWVQNTLTVRGESNLLSLFESRVGQSYVFENVPSYDFETKQYITKDIECNEPFSFWNIVHPPKDKWALYHATANGTQNQIWNWYAWNNANWGCKWDASNVEVKSMPNNVEYHFATPWSPPLLAIHQASLQYPDLYLELRYIEEQGWGGKIVLNNGDVLAEKTWDIPETHAEMIQADLECWCDEESSPDEKPFKDCP